MKRKPQQRAQSANKKCRHETKSNAPEKTIDLLRCYYKNVCTLREYLCCRIPATSKHRKRIILNHDRSNITPNEQSAAKQSFLDTTLVGCQKYVPLHELSSIERDVLMYTQHLTGSVAGLSASQKPLAQAEIIDFCVWKLQNNVGEHISLDNMLYNSRQAAHMDTTATEYARQLKSAPWDVLPKLLGKNADRILVDMFMEAGIYVAVEQSLNMLQVAGSPLSNMQRLIERQDLAAMTATPMIKQLDAGQGIECRLNAVKISRHRMLYSRLSDNPSSCTNLGRAHILNQIANRSTIAQVAHTAKYIFPAQFGLSNVFDLSLSTSGPAAAFSPHREDEIAKMKQCRTAKSWSIPNRLKGPPIRLVEKIKRRHGRTDYNLLLRHYCSGKSTAALVSSTEHATPESQVSAFCQAAVANVFGKECFGTIRNWGLVAASIDRFLRMRKYELVTMHEVMQGLSIAEISWLVPTKMSPTTKMSKQDFVKRKQLLAELLYFTFDGFLAPLIKCNFYVTESTTHRHRLFYFKHSVWKMLCKPALDNFRLKMLEPLDAKMAREKASNNSLGVSYIRMLPKANGMRPITNLRRNMTRLQNGKVILGRSINSILQPAFAALNYEKTMRPELLGSSIFSVDEIYRTVRGFKQKLQQYGHFGKPLYFAKIDVKSCFDSIPQQRMIERIQDVLKQERYSIMRFSRAKFSGRQRGDLAAGLPRWKWQVKANDMERSNDLRMQMTTDAEHGQRQWIYVDKLGRQQISRQAVLRILQEHIESNLVKIDKQTYRQKTGIAQGAVTSTLLCSLLYSEMEGAVFGGASVDKNNTMLLHLIDDFLLVTTEKETAMSFMHTMHTGLADYGVEVQLSKSRANFDIMIDGQAVPRVPAESEFAYCAQTINTVTLDIGKDLERKRLVNMGDTILVEHSRMPGKVFERKILNALQIQMREMMVSCAHNTKNTILRNMHHILVEVAQKTYHWIRSMAIGNRIPDMLVTKTINSLVCFAVKLMKQRNRSENATLTVNALELRWLAYNAYASVFGSKQSLHRELLAWLRIQLTSHSTSKVASAMRSAIEAE